MRSPVGELVSAVRGVVARPRNDAPIPYTPRAGGVSYGSGTMSVDMAASIEAPGSNGTLFAIMTQLATSVAAVSWHMHELGKSASVTCDECGQEGVALVTSHPALSVWNRPNDFFTQQLLIESFQQHVDLVGEGWLVVAYVGKRPIELWPVRPDRIAPVRDREKFISGYAYRSPDGQVIPLRLDEVISLRTPAPWDVYRGAGAVQTLLNQIWGAQYAAEWNRKFFQNSAMPGGVIELPIHLPDQQWNEFQDRWTESHKGVNNAHTVAVLEHGAKWVETHTTQKDMEFPELTRVHSAQIREAFAVHGHVLGLSDDINRANAEAGEYGFAKRQTVPRLERIRDMLDGPYLRLFGDFGKGHAFAYTSPVPTDRESDNAERTSKASAFKTLLDGGADPVWAAQVCGLPRPVMAGGASGGSGDPRAIAEMIQKIYLGVGVMLTDAEARDIVNRSGAGLRAGPMPAAPKAPDNDPFAG